VGATRRKKKKKERSKQAAEWAPSGTIDGYVTGGVFSLPVVFGGVVYVAGIDGTLTAIKE